MINLDLIGFKHHCVIDNFIHPSLAKELADEFPDYNSNDWVIYDNKVENKKSCNSWNLFPPATYRFFSFMNALTPKLSETFGEIYSDPGLHGGGWHIHGKGGNLNPHLDYDIHPKLGLKRKLNIIIYLSDLTHSDGGQFGFFENGECIQEINIRFNRAVIFETENTWHGMVRPLSGDTIRKSLAVYYLATANGQTRQRALFTPRPEQRDDPEILKFIEERAK